MFSSVVAGRADLERNASRRNERDLPRLAVGSEAGGGLFGGGELPGRERLIFVGPERPTAAESSRPWEKWTTTRSIRDDVGRTSQPVRLDYIVWPDTVASILNAARVTRLLLPQRNPQLVGLGVPCEEEAARGASVNSFESLPFEAARFDYA